MRWVAKDLPLTITLPWSDMRYRWLQGDDMLARLRYTSFGIQPGWYLRPDTEIAVSAEYIQPDFFYSVSDFDYGYLAWDIYVLSAKLKTVLPLPGGYWLSAEPTLVRMIDQHDNTLVGGAFAGRFYLTPQIGFGASFSHSRFSGNNDSWAANLRAMGVTEFGLLAQVDIGWRWGLTGRISYQKPAEASINARTVMSFEAVGRW